MLRIFFTLSAALLIAGIPAGSFAKSKRSSSQTQSQGGSPGDAACAGSVKRFCKGTGSDQMAILACLQKNRPRISGACRKVLESHGV